MTPPRYPKRISFAETVHASPGAVRREMPDGKVRGLYLIIQPTGAKTWAVRYRKDGRARKLTLGPFPLIGLDAARKLASAALLSVASGADPAADKAQARRLASARAADDRTFAGVYERYKNEHLSRLALSTLRVTDGIFTKYLLPKFGRRLIDDITPRDVKHLTNTIRAAGYETTANKVFIAARALLNWTVAEYIAPANPLVNMKRPSPERERDRYLSDSEIRESWNAAAVIGYPFGTMVKLLFLTGARRGEVQGMTREELDLDAAIWTIPADRSKNGRAHAVPLSPLALETLATIPRIRDAKYLFTTDGIRCAANFAHGKARIDALMTPCPPWVLHDIRRTVATKLGELGIAPHVTEAVLNHKSGVLRGVAKVYQRYRYAAEMRAALETWSAHLTDLIRPDTSRPKR